MQHTVHHEILSNGISLIVVPLKNTATVTSIVLMGVGSRYESDLQRGLAHFTEHMVFKGGRKYTTAQHIAQTLDSVGGEFNAFTSQEFTGFYTKTAAEHTELGLDVLSDMTLHATFPAEELEKEKGVIVEEINMYEDMPMRKVDYVLLDLLFGDTPLGRPILGTKQSVTSFTREDFVKYREQFYMGEKCTVAIAGDIDPAKARELVSQYFAELPKGLRYESVGAVIREDIPRVQIEEKKSEQSHLMLALRAYPMSDERGMVVKLLTTILGGNMSSRLFVSVRERQGLCYYVRASVDSYLDQGFIIASAGVDNTRLPKAVEAIMGELRNIKEQGINDEELHRAKEFMVGKAAIAMESSDEVAEHYGLQDLLERKQTPVQEEIDKIRRVTKQDIAAVVADLFTDKGLRLAAISPHQDASSLDALLKF